MLFDIRGYRPGENVNVVGDMFDYVSDVETLDAAEDMLAAAKARAADFMTRTPGEYGSPDSMPRLWAEARLAEMNATILAGVVAQAQTAVRSYPADVVQYAVNRHPFLADS